MSLKPRIEFVLDVSEVKARMQLLNRRILPRKIRRGLTLAGTKLMNDVVIDKPTTPIHRPDYASLSRKAGELRASGALFVGKVKKGSTQKMGEAATGKYQPQKYGGTRIKRNVYQACVVFNAPYAAVQHEAFPDKTQPGAGMNYLRSKLYGNAREYIAIIARAVRL